METSARRAMAVASAALPLRSRRDARHRSVSRRPLAGSADGMSGMSGMSGREYRERLIDAVKKYPVLYDTRHENTRDIDVRDRCWIQISEHLGVHSDILKRDWKSLRDSLRQALKNSTKGTTTKTGVPCRKWRFQNRMAFVLPYMTVRRQRVPKTDIKINETDAHSEAEPDSEVLELDGKDQHSLELFFASVCQSTRRLPRRFQDQIKKQVLDVLLRVEEEYETEIRQPEANIYKT